MLCRNCSACPGESISASEMEGFIREVKKITRTGSFIIDSAPSHITAAARVIANYVDGILFVVMAQKWPRKEIQKSIGALGKEKILGVVFNGYVQARRRYLSTTTVITEANNEGLSVVFVLMITLLG